MKGGYALDAATRGSLLTMVLILSFDSASEGAALSGTNCLSSKQFLDRDIAKLICARSGKVKRGNSDTNFDLSGLLPPTNGQHPRCLCCRIQ